MERRLTVTAPDELPIFQETAAAEAAAGMTIRIGA
jgi:hypothetical protein